MADTTIIIKKRRRIIIEPKELKVKAPAEPVEVGKVDVQKLHCPPGMREDIPAKLRGSARRNYKKNTRTQERLSQFWPMLFSEYKPLALKISEAMVNDARERDLPISEVQIKQYLVRYTQSARYVMSVVEGTHRFNLNGEPVDLISDEHRERAREKILKLRKAMNSK